MRLFEERLNNKNAFIEQKLLLLSTHFRIKIEVKILHSKQKMNYQITEENILKSHNEIYNFKLSISLQFLKSNYIYSFNTT